MKKKSGVILLSGLVFFILTLGGAAYLIWGRNQMEIQVLATKKSPDGKWIAVVQMEIYSAPAFVNDAVYAVRLKGIGQKDALGDLAMNMPVNYREPEPVIDWRGHKLVITLSNHQKPQYLANPVNGVSIDLREDTAL